jgi:hypothetical protein
MTPACCTTSSRCCRQRTVLGLLGRKRRTSLGATGVKARRLCCLLNGRLTISWFYRNELWHRFWRRLWHRQVRLAGAEFNARLSVGVKRSSAANKLAVAAKKISSGAQPVMAANNVGNQMTRESRATTTTLALEDAESIVAVGAKRPVIASSLVGSGALTPPFSPPRRAKKLDQTASPAARAAPRDARWGEQCRAWQVRAVSLSLRQLRHRGGGLSQTMVRGLCQTVWRCQSGSSQNGGREARGREQCPRGDIPRGCAGHRGLYVHHGLVCAGRHSSVQYHGECRSVAVHWTVPRHGGEVAGRGPSMITYGIRSLDTNAPNP